MATLRLVSYNIHGLKDDSAATIEVIRDLEPDVLFVQEAFRRFRWRHHCAELARRSGLLYASGGLPGLGNLVLVSQRVRVHSAWGVRYPLTPGRHMRGAALATCSVGRSPFVAVGTHLATDDNERPAQAARLAFELEQLDAGPVLFGADLNETAGGSGWRTLADGRTDAAGADGSNTFSVQNPSRRIDAIFVDPPCAVSNYRVVDTPASRRASDHFPIYAEVEL